MASNAKIRVTVTLQPSGKSSVLIVQTLDDLLRQCSSKLRVKARRIFLASTGEELLTDLSKVSNDMKLIVTCGDTYTVTNPPSTTQTNSIIDSSKVSVQVIANRTLVEQEAIDQLKNVARIYPHVKHIWGMPDLHVGQATPIGCVVATEPSVVYPELIGSDIGCGMSFVRTSLRLVYEDDDRKLSKWTKQLQGLDDYLPKERIDEFLQSDLQWPTTVNKVNIDHSENEQLGTIGAGNHFVELQRIEELYDDKEEDLSKDYLYLLVHSGSRSLGERILREFCKGKGELRGLEKGTDDYDIYMSKHDEACAWAKRNRALIAQRFLTCLGQMTTSAQCLVDIWHNNVVLKDLSSDNSQVHLHRKGAAPSDTGRVVIPGSRGTHSYLVEPIDQNQESSGYSLAHGAGRAMSRSKAHQRFSGKYPDSDRLRITETLDSHVVCDDKQLLYEEHPEAYKTIDAVIDDLVEAKLIRVIAKMRPLITYKTRLTHKE
ncbi:unnamed protein product [Adineta steineri]|uniref:3'-phosphate/5'-hydroxy nucleic acid ligase n=1 Tax=Adineta steineri TaxID=433720 RepID=A0A815DS35_9BILA|nr:unnamed protein product [Adineta steineri]CAF1229980.1 unnamed protein product [Adineta steineri]CAF1301935.1 unnamed protein product [Adineta steineri]